MKQVRYIVICHNEYLGDSIYEITNDRKAAFRAAKKLRKELMATEEAVLIKEKLEQKKIKF